MVHETRTTHGQGAVPEEETTNTIGKTKMITQQTDEVKKENEIKGNVGKAMPEEEGGL